MERKAFVDTLELVRPALADQAVVPIFLNYCFTGERVYAYNDQLGIVGPAETNRAFAVHGKTLLNLLSNSKAREIELEFTEEEVLVKAGRSRMKLPWVNEEEFIFKEPEEVEWPIVISGKRETLQMLEAVLKTVSDDTAFPTLMGVTLAANKDGVVTAYSCDGDAVSKYVMPKDVGKGPANTALTAPTSFFRALQRIVKVTEAEEFEVTVSEEWAVAHIGDYSIYGRIILNSSPMDHEEMISKILRGKSGFFSIPQPLEQALSRARVLADAENTPTTLSFKEGKLRLSTETHNGAVRDVITVEADIEEIEVSVSAAAIQNVLGSCTEMLILDQCTAYRCNEELLQVISNLGD